MAVNDDPSTISDHRIWVADPSSRLAQAIERGGGTPTNDPTGVTGVVWTGKDLSELRDLLTPAVEWLQLPSAGIERYVAAGVVEPTRTNTCAGPAYAKTVAEHALALMLACSRRLPTYSRARRWERVEISSVLGATVAIVGCGRIGRALIDLLGPFQARILACNRSGRPVEGATQTGDMAFVDRAIEQADFVVVAAPATPETKGLIGKRQLERMPSNAYLINIARGSLVDTDALVDALRAGSIAGAALDVTDPEPLPDGHPLWELDRALITPHVANPDAWDEKQLVGLVEENVRRFLAGEELLGVVDPARGY